MRYKVEKKHNIIYSQYFTDFYCVSMMWVVHIIYYNNTWNHWLYLKAYAYICAFNRIQRKEKKPKREKLPEKILITSTFFQESESDAMQSSNFHRHQAKSKTYFSLSK